MRSHEACEMFPMIGGGEFAALKADIAKNGQREPILLVDGELIDGRNRLRACTELGVDPVFRNMTRAEAGDVFALVMSLNFHRRHLEPHQMGKILAGYMERVGVQKSKGGRPAKNSTNSVELPKTVASVAKDLGVPEQTARNHLKAAESYAALPTEKKEAVDKGIKSLPKAVAEVKAEQHAETHKTEDKPKGKRAAILAAYAHRRAGELLATMEGASMVCENASVEAIRGDEQLLGHWITACNEALKAIRAFLRQLEQP